MKNIKFIILAIVIIIIIGTLVIVDYMNGNKEIYKNTQPDKQLLQQETEETEETNTTKEVTNSAMYFTVKACIDTYMKYLSEQNREAIYSLLSTSYIQEKSINVNNVLNYVPRLDGNSIDFSIQEMRVENDGENLQTYYANGIIRDENNNKKNSQITINVDITNKVFTIIPNVIEGVFNEY